jgi:hypothetical protein
LYHSDLLEIIGNNIQIGLNKFPISTISIKNPNVNALAPAKINLANVNSFNGATNANNAKPTITGETSDNAPTTDNTKALLLSSNATAQSIPPPD